MTQKNTDYCEVPTTELLNKFDNAIPSKYGYGVRHIQFVIFFICMTVTFIARGHIGVTIVAMTHIPQKNASTEHYVNISTEFDDNVTVNVDKVANESLDSNDMEGDENNLGIEIYDWDKKTQEIILGSFFAGYSLTMIPCGILSQRWGVKIPLQISLLLNGIMSIVTPWCTAWGGWMAICGCRFIQGVLQSGSFPWVQLLVSNWAPLPERGFVSSFIYAGTIFGTVLAFQIGGLLSNSPWGWPSTFWAVGAICIVCFALLTIFGASSPNDHKSISKEEKNYILGNLPNSKGNKKVPWKSIITSRPVWATYATNYTSACVFVFMFTQVTSYLHYILGINVSNSGLLSSLPYIGSMFSNFLYGFLSDYCTNRNIFSIKNTRRIVNSISQVGVAIFLILASFAPSTAWAVTFFVITVSCHMGVHTGWMLNQIDLAPNYTGIVMTMGNVMAAVIVQLVPVLISYIVVDVRDIVQWRIVFGVIAAWAVLGNLIFVIFISAENQPWNDYADVSTDEEKIKDEKIENKTDFEIN